MNSIKSYKALSIVANVEQGSLIKRLIKENKEMKQELKNMKEVCGVKFLCDNCVNVTSFLYRGRYYKQEEFECEDCE